MVRHHDQYYFPAVRTISSKPSKALVRPLENEAHIRKVTKLHLVRASLEKTLAEENDAGRRSCYELASDLAGKVKKLPKDLATNPAYLEGFGQ
jgi:hypothetical protein